MAESPDSTVDTHVKRLREKLEARATSRDLAA